MRIQYTVYIYYSKVDKCQNFNFVCRRSCVSDTKDFMIGMWHNFYLTNMIAFVSVFLQIVFAGVQMAPTPHKIAIVPDCYFL